MRCLWVKTSKPELPPHSSPKTRVASPLVHWRLSYASITVVRYYIGHAAATKDDRRRVGEGITCTVKSVRSSAPHETQCQGGYVAIRTQDGPRKQVSRHIYRSPLVLNTVSPRPFRDRTQSSTSCIDCSPSRFPRCFLYSWQRSMGDWPRSSCCTFRKKGKRSSRSSVLVVPLTIERVEVAGTENVGFVAADPEKFLVVHFVTCPVKKTWGNSEGDSTG